MKRVAVTGASGFLGREVVKLLCAKNVEVSCTGRRVGGQAYLPNYHIVDFAEKEFSGEFLKNCDAVINCAGSVHNNFNSKSSINTHFDINSDAAMRLARLAAQHKVKKFIQVSTVSVYGECFPSKVETDIAAPENLYGESNLDAETRLLEFCTDGPLDLIVLRLTTLYGEGDPGNIAKLIRFLSKPYAFLLGDGKNKKSLIHVTDAARAIIAALSPEITKTEGKVFNISDQPIDNKEIYRLILQCMNRSNVPALPDSFINLVCKSLAPFTENQGGAKKVLSTIKKLTQSDLINGDKFRNSYNFKYLKRFEIGIAEEVKFIAANKLKKYRLTRIFDIFVSSVALIVFMLPIIFLCIFIKMSSKGPVFYWSDRIGKNNKIFKMAKFRSMRIETPELATHLLTESQRWVTPIGKIIRKTSLDELPQLWHILEGKMSFVGPRPALFNQNDLIVARTAMQVDSLTPGITGLAQISGRDELNIFEKVVFDREYLKRKHIILNIKIIFKTFIQVFTGSGVLQANEVGVKQSQNNLCEIYPEKSVNFYAAGSSLLTVSLSREKLVAKGIDVGVFSVRNFETLHEKELTSLDFILCSEIERRLIDKSVTGNIICLPESNFYQPPYYLYKRHSDYFLEYLNNVL